MVPRAEQSAGGGAKRPRRAQLLGRLSGCLLDVGVSTGRYLPFYPLVAEVVGIDISAGMPVRAAKAIPFSPAIDLRELDLTCLDFERSAPGPGFAPMPAQAD